MDSGIKCEIGFKWQGRHLVKSVRLAKVGITARPRHTALRSQAAFSLKESSKGSGGQADDQKPWLYGNMTQ